MLQSVVCHRGSSVHSGHYVALCRGRAANADAHAGLHPQGPDDARRRGSPDSGDEDAAGDLWMRFDDLARERVAYVDIHAALRAETPYLLFYQVVPVGEDGEEVHDLPSYAEATSRRPSEGVGGTTGLGAEKPYLHRPGSETALALAHRDSASASESEA
ncbi:hypothetical protein LTR53_019186, partial [Teratosphaeriaceae sp. CCFEE 6253]